MARVELAGAWRERAGDGPDWAAPGFDDTAWRTVVLPGSWDEQGLKGLEGPVWYRRVVTLREPLAGSSAESWGVLVGRTRFGTVDVWINGVAVGSVGGPTLPVPVPALRALAVPREAIAGRDRLAFAIRVTRVAWASDRAAAGGPVGSNLVFAPYRDLADRVELDRSRELIGSLPMLLAALLFLGVGLGFSYLWASWRFGSEHLWFGLVALGFAANSFLISPWVFEVTERFPLVIRLTEISGVLLPAVFIQFLWTYLKRPRSALLRAYQGSFGVLAVAIAVWPSPGWILDTRGMRWLWLVPLLAAGLRAVIVEARRGNRSARSIVLVGALLAGAELLAVLGNLLPWFPSLALEPAWAFVAFVLAMGLVLSDRLNHLRLELDDQVASLTLTRQDLRESEDRYRTILEQAADAVFLHDGTGRIIDVNRRACENLGYSREELLSKSIGEIGPQATPTGRGDWWAGVLAGERFTFEGSQVRKDGSTFPVEVTLGSVNLPRGPVVLGMVRDITERKRAEDALRESELQFRTLAETTGVGILIVQDERFVYGNPTAERMSGYTAGELAGMEFWELVHPDYRDLVRRHAAARVSGARDVPTSYEIKAAGKDGVARWFSLTAGATTLGGRPAIVISLIDVDEEHRLRNLQTALYEISEAAQSTRSLEELSRSIHAIVGRLMEARNFFIALHDSRSGLLTFPYFVDEFDPPPAPRRSGRGMTEYVLRTGQPQFISPEAFDDLVQRAEIEAVGTPPVDWLGVPLKVQDTVIGVLAVQSYRGTVRYSEADKDVLSYVSAEVAQAIARKRTEEALRESEDRFRQSIEAFSDGFVLVDEQGAVIEWNAALERLLGITRAEALGEPLWDVEWRAYAPERRTPGQYEFVKGSILNTIQTGRLPSLPGQIEILSVDGRRRTITQSVFAITTQKGSRVGLVIRDITERIELEGQLRQAQKMEAVGSLAGGVAHDFNNLLQALLSQTQLLRTHADDPERVKALSLELGQQVKHGASLTRQLLLFSRRETTRPEPLDLNGTVRAATSMLRRLVRANITLEIDLAPEALPVSADRGHLEQVLVNLALNASDAMPEGGKLVIRTGALEGTQVWLSVEDTGVGIPESIRERIFEPFFTTKGTGKGTGLGLSVVHGIVTRHGGRIEVESVEGRGSTFKVILPKVASGEFAPVSEAPAAVSELPAGHGERVLVVEDEDGAREGLRDILRSLGYEVIAAASGEEAGALPAEAPFDVLLTDLMLPGISGSQLAAGLQERWPRLKVILMSGYTEDEAVRTGVGAGAIRFLQKPFDMTRLAREVRAALDEAPGTDLPV